MRSHLKWCGMCVCVFRPASLCPHRHCIHLKPSIHLSLYPLSFCIISFRSRQRILLKWILCVCVCCASHSVFDLCVRVFIMFLCCCMYVWVLILILLACWCHHSSHSIYADIRGRESKKRFACFISCSDPFI